VTFIRAKEIPPRSGNWYDYEVETVHKGGKVIQRHIRYIGKSTRRASRSEQSLKMTNRSIAMATIGLALSFAGTLLMFPESLRLTRKNPEGAIRWSTGMSYAPYLFLSGVILLALGFFLQLFASFCLP
jgi:hypothetical protein